MPPYFNLRSSTPHRVACIALYRALLAQCPRIYIPIERWRGPINPIKHLIRKRFHKQQHQQSQRLVVDALKLGYQTEELLRIAGDGDEEAVSKVIGIVREHQERGDATRELHAQNPTPLRGSGRPKPAPYPGAKKMLDVRPRPLSELSGQRRVPKLQHTIGGIPFLLYKKPQSEFLTRVVRQRVKKYVKLSTAVIDVGLDYEMAMYEDQWEKITSTKSTGGPWTAVVSSWKQKTWDEIYKMKTDHMNIAKKMIDVIDKEKMLADQENENKKAENIQRRKEKQVEKDSLEVP